MAQFLRKVSLAFTLTMSSISVTMAAYPSQPLRLIVGYSAGGSVDIVARNYAQRMAKKLGQPVIVENKGGAGGTVAAQFVTNSNPDGYVLYFVASPTLTIAPAIQKVTFDPVSGFTAIGTVVDYFNVLMVRADSPYLDLQDLLKDASSRPGEITYGSAGVGAANHISGALLADQAKVEMTHVPYKGNAPAMMSLLSGEISFAFDVNNTAMNHIGSGKMRALAITSAARHSSFPGVPTLKEAGYNEAEFTGWFGVVGPAGMSPQVTDALSTAHKEILHDETFQKQATEWGYGLPDSNSSPSTLKIKIKQDGDRFTELAKRMTLNNIN